MIGFIALSSADVVATRRKESIGAEHSHDAGAFGAPSCLRGFRTFLMSGDDTKTLVGMIHPGFPHADDVLRIQPLLRADLGEEQRLSGKVF